MLNKNTMVNKDDLIEELRLKVSLLTDAVAYLRKETPEQPGLREELAQYKEWFEAMTRQLAKRHNRIHELTVRIKEIGSTQLEDCSLRGQRDRAEEELRTIQVRLDNTAQKAKELGESCVRYSTENMRLHDRTQRLQEILKQNGFVRTIREDGWLKTIDGFERVWYI